MSEDFDEGGFVEVIQDADDGQAGRRIPGSRRSEKVLRRGLLEELGIALAGFQ